MSLKICSESPRCWAFLTIYRLPEPIFGQGLRADLERLEGDTVAALIKSLQRHGVSEELLQEALAEVTQR